MTEQPSGKLYTAVTKYWPRIAAGFTPFSKRALGGVPEEWRHQRPQNVREKSQQKEVVMRSTSRGVLIWGLLAIFLLPIGLSAQMTIGIGGGLVSSSFTGDDVDDDLFDPKTGFSFGGWLAIPIGDRVSIVPGALYTQKGATDNVPGLDFALSLAYIEIPVVLSVSLTGPDSQLAFNLFGGPSLAFNTSCDLAITEDGVTLSFDCEEADGEVHTLDIGAVVGASVNIPAGESLFIFVNGGVDMSLTPFDASDDQDDVKNRAFFLSAGVAFPLGG